MRHRAERFGLRHHAESRDPMSAMLYLRSTRVEGERPADGDRQPGRNENRRYSNRDVRNGGLDVWYRITKRARWKNINGVRGAYPKAGQVGTCVVFDIGGNKYRLITHIDYATEAKGKKKAFGGRVLTFDVLTHKEYDTDRWKTKYCGCK
jgi:mRNA interferase HigB